MRITSGIHRSKEISAPKGRDTRPTSDRIRESIFNILRHCRWKGRPLNQATVLDIFAGTGALGLEALSQGAKDAVFIENNYNAIKTCNTNIEKLGEKDRCLIIKHDAVKTLKRPDHIDKRSLIFIDPPYGKDLGIKALVSFRKNDWLADGFTCVMEMAKKDPEIITDDFIVEDERTYGITKILFLTLKQNED